MTKEPENGFPEVSEAETAPGTDSVAAEAPDETDLPGDGFGFQAHLDRERQARDQLQQQYVRLLADFENYKRRSRQELAAAGQQSQELLVLSLLPVLDNLERALGAGGDSCDSLRAGMHMISRQLLDTLKQSGLEAIAAAGLPFDPEYHEAVARVGDTGDQPAVTKELRRGYTFRGKVIRPSMVEVGAPEGQTAEALGVEGDEK